MQLYIVGIIFCALVAASPLDNGHNTDTANTDTNRADFPLCTNNKDCNDGVCFMGICLAPDDGYTCKRGLDCPKRYKCVKGICRKLNSPRDETGTDASTESITEATTEATTEASTENTLAPNKPCKKNSECKETGWCLWGTCVDPVCKKDKTCPRGHRCRKGRCKEEFVFFCKVDEHCNVDHRCTKWKYCEKDSAKVARDALEQGGKECTKNQQCRMTGWCHENKCLNPKCSKHDDCPSGFACYHGSCARKSRVMV
ncbi:hypothetical protein BDV25DRAFT_136981 [Aspergillus avenaceus]|uniref:Dickkopf N-terminal cysteine-rich domain-containing protein n=1 Tax=Aspergillus avenaceus TaxID=36643 RepID=A0A5N6U464_ASPAV|nr:hypothetical protein BDV25DRAFT_136981 [Aspergillus avenaceus]